MRRGTWHQCGDKSQKLALEQLQHGAGVGVILSPRDLSRENAISYAQDYHAAGAHVLIDSQFYEPDFTNQHLETYPLSSFRNSVSVLHKLSDQQLVEFENALRTDHDALKADGLIAPAVVYEASRQDVVELNSRLFEAARQVGTDLGIPTYATVVLGRSVTSADQIVLATLSEATRLDADGWYFSFEFEEERLPSDRDAVRRCAMAGLALACTGRPVLHAFAGPLGLVAFGYGASGVGVGHSQNLWKFTRERWDTPTTQGGGGQAPARFFSSSLWGTIIYPDETALLDPALCVQVLQPNTPFCQPVLSTPPLDWSRWEAGKHLVHTLATTFDQLAQNTDARANANQAIAILGNALQLHQNIRNQNVTLGDSTDAYQNAWRQALLQLLNSHSGDFDYLHLLVS